MLKLVRRFLRDRAGSYAPLFAIASLPVLGSVSAAIEYSQIYRVHNAIQSALDAAALAAARELVYTNDEAYLEAYGRDFFESNLNDAVSPADVDIDLDYVPGTTASGRIEVSAHHVYDTYMAGVIGITDVPMRVTASIETGNRTIEVALVVDNSGSMANASGSGGMTRMQLARQAASDLVKQLSAIAALSTKHDPIRISVVPFAGSVNVGSQWRGADWLDMRGWSSIHHENIDWPGTSSAGDSWPNAARSGAGWRSSTTSTSSVGPTPPAVLPAGITSYSMDWLSRWTLYDALLVPWAGCVEMRPSPFNSTDAPPSDLTPDTLFVPMFAPDEPERRSGEDNDYTNRYLADYVRAGSSFPVRADNSGTFSRQLLRQSWSRKYNLDARQRDSSNRVLIGQQRSRDFGPYGPNQGCTTTAITPLSANMATVQAAIAAMQPAGFTNLQEGLAWGWRTLSAGQPFTQGRGYDVPENDKYIILLTDGNNTFPPQYTLNTTEYYPWGYGRHNRLFGGLTNWTSEADAMNQQTARTCANIKAMQDADNEAAIRIFTIVYDVPDNSPVKALLRDCASTGTRGESYYFDVQGDAITDAMASIGSVISELRIAR